MLVSSLEIYADCAPNGWVHALGGCGVNTRACQLTPMQVKKLEKRPD
jgi:hypothetical protein